MRNYANRIYRFKPTKLTKYLNEIHFGPPPLENVGYTTSLHQGFLNYGSRPHVRSQNSF